MKPCYENQVRDKLKIDPLIAREFMNATLEHMKPKWDAINGKVIDGLGVDHALEKVANASGLSIETVAKILKSDTKIKSISKQAFSRQREAANIKLAARTIADLGIPQHGHIARVFSDVRKLILTGHAPVFPFTHARNLLYGSAAERKIFVGMVHDAWAFRGEKGALNHALAMAEMKKDSTFGLERSAGLAVEEGMHRGDMLVSPESGTVVSKGMQKGGEWLAKTRIGKFMRLGTDNASRSFDALKIGRHKLFKHYWEQQPPELKTEAYAQLLARDMNYATGAVTTPRGAASTPLDRLVSAASDASGNILLSSKLFYGKRMEAANIFRYGPSRLSDLISKGGKMTVEERAIANLGLKRWARITATQIGIVGANYAFAKAMGLRLPNISDPDSADYLRMRIGNFVVPLSPLLEAVREPVRAVATAIKKRSVYEGGKELARPVINALTPGIQITGEQITGKEPFSGRTVPSIRNLIQTPKPGKQPPVSATEYATTRVSPIAVGGGLHEFYQALRDEGVPASTALPFIKGASGALTSGFAGTHIYEDKPKDEKAQDIVRPPLR